MINGIGYSELFAIAVLFLLFFGSKELPRLLREGGKLYAKARRYTESVRRELDTISRSVDPPQPINNEVAQKKKLLRKRFRDAREALTPDERREKSAVITAAVMEIQKVRDARVIMLYLERGAEVGLREFARQLVAAGKRVVIPYCKPAARDLGIAEVSNIDAQTVPGVWDIPEPIESIRDNFLRSDLSVILCPGVGFDPNGGRLGNGKGYYDNFLRELRGRVYTVGVAFDCQISDEPFPFDYSDVPVDQVVTESGVLIKDRENGLV